MIRGVPDPLPDVPEVVLSDYILYAAAGRGRRVGRVDPANGERLT